MGLLVPPRFMNTILSFTSYTGVLEPQTKKEDEMK